MALPFLLLASSAGMGLKSILTSGAFATGAGLGLKALSMFGSNAAEDQAMEEQSLMNDLSFKTAENEIGLRMDQEALSAQEQSLFNLTRLREVMSTQRAMMGARGQKSGAGSAGTIQNKALSVYNADERAANLMASFKKLQLQGQLRGLNLKKLTGQAKISNYKNQRSFRQSMDWAQTGLNMFTQGDWGQKKNG